MCSIPDILKEQTQVGWKDRDVLLQAPESLCQLGFDIRGFKGTLGPDATSRVAPPVWIGTLKSLHFTAPHFAFLTEILKDVGRWFRDDKQPPGIGTLVRPQEANPFQAFALRDWASLAFRGKLRVHLDPNKPTSSRAYIKRSYQGTPQKGRVFIRSSWGFRASRI